MSEAEIAIIQKESSFRTEAKNPKSTAFGLWQGLAGIRAKYSKKVGVDPNTTDAAEQIAMFRVYVAERYGTAEKAWEFWQKNGWY